jgi:hypothetical protein
MRVEAAWIWLLIVCNSLALLLVILAFVRGNDPYAYGGISGLSVPQVLMLAMSLVYIVLACLAIPFRNRGKEGAVAQGLPAVPVQR